MMKTEVISHEAGGEAEVCGNFNMTLSSFDAERNPSRNEWAVRHHRESSFFAQEDDRVHQCG